MPLSPVKPPPIAWPGPRAATPPPPPVRFGRPAPPAGALQAKLAPPIHAPPKRPTGARVVQRAEQNPKALTVVKAGSAAAPAATPLTPLVDRLKRTLALVTKGQSWLRAAGSGISDDAFETFKGMYEKRAGDLALAAKKAGYSAATVGTFSDFVVDVENTVRLIALANMVAYHKDLKALARLREVSKPVKTYIDGVILHQIVYTPTIRQPVTFGDVTEHLRGYRFAGLHGSSSANAVSLYGGLKAPAAGQLNYAISQLGAGFYLTEGGGAHGLNAAYAKSVAELNVKKAGGVPYSYKVLLQNPAALSTREVPQAHWNNMAHNAPNPLLQQHMGSDLMTAAIVDNNPARQIKVNASAFDKVMVMPPNAAGTDAAAWLKARFDPKPK